METQIAAQTGLLELLPFYQLLSLSQFNAEVDYMLSSQTL